MLATARRRAFSRPGWLFELKYDGFRLFATKERDRVTLRYRTGRDATAVFPEIADAVAALPATTLALDGEVAVLGADGKPDFEALQSLAFRGATRRLSAMGRPTAFVFDLLLFDYLDLRPVPLLARKECLRELLPDDGRLRYVDHVEERGEVLFDGAKRLGLEGIVAKRANSPYRSGRSNDWLKVKAMRTGDFVAVGISEPGRATYDLPGLILARVDASQLVYVGKVGLPTGPMAAVTQVLALLARSTSPCSGGGRAHTCVEPTLLCEVRFLTFTSAGLLRQPVFLRFRPDKSRRACSLGCQWARRHGA